VTELLKRLRANASKREALSAERDALIREAKAAGVPVTHIAEAIGLTRQQVHRILAEQY
jgi:DNA invertase Pin-like site-specific DNA recombinase